MATRNTKKQEVNEKVKEIKRMRQNWMKQRSEALDSGERVASTEPGQKKVSSSGKPPSHPQPKPNITTFTCGKPGYKGHVTRAEQQSGTRDKTRTEQPRFNPPTNIPYSETARKSVSPEQSHGVNHKDGVKLGSVKGKKQGSESLYHDNRDFKDKFRHWLNVKNEQVDDESVSKVKLAVNHEERTGFPENVQVNSEASETAIESLADNIVSRVRHELYPGVERTDEPYYKKTQKTGPLTPRNGTSGQVTARSDVSSIWGGSDGRSLADDDRYDSHICPVCRQLMVSPHQPMLLIPCGHTGCKPCLTSRVLCPMCGADIKSQMINTMLQQIILNHKEEVEAKSRLEYSASKYTSGPDYEEEYTTLSIRCEALSEELRESNKSLERISGELTQEQKQYNNIEQEEHKIEKQITELQESLAQLNMHKAEYKQNCRQLELKHSEEVKKVALLQATLHGLQMEMDKVQILRDGRRT